ncbi:P-loop containing nucleoside triphosphate hydrolase protein [Mycena floridula]|nr:P-loop containing nucleoside triphosphate hydrolase protein [Mycena floridula]
MESTPEPPNFVAFRRQNWLGPVGRNKIADAVAEKLAFSPAEYQLDCAGRILKGQDVICLAATGEGKTALVYLPLMVQANTIGLLVAPTNSLEADMVAGFRAKGLTAVAINSETLAEAAMEKRDLWDEAMQGLYRILLISPETTKTTKFDCLINNNFIRPRLSQFTVDEVHLVDEWGAEFRQAYSDLGTLRARLPDHCTFVALSATVEPGQQLKRIISSLGFREGHYHLEKRDCERHNVNLTIRVFQHSSTGFQFRDLDWLIPLDLKSASEILKTILYTDTIELGHRIVVYLRQLLPPSLRHLSHILIRHMHSLRCPECKKDVLEALHESGDERSTAIFVSTNVLGQGLDVPDVQRMVTVPCAATLAELLQRLGRVLRNRQPGGEAIMYVRHTEIAAVKEYLKSDDLDSRLLEAIDPPEPEAPPPTKRRKMTTSKKPSVKKRSSKATAPTKGPSKSKDLAMQLVLAAHIRRRCLIRQINVIYGNPGANVDCGRCSVCIPDIAPSARPLSTDLPPIDPALPPAVIKKVRTPKGKPTIAELDDVAAKIEAGFIDIYISAPPRSSFIFLSPRCILPAPTIKLITTNFLDVTTKEVLAVRLKSWKYWDEFSSSLWDVVDQCRKELALFLVKKQALQLQKRRDGAERGRQLKVRKALAAVGLDGVTKVHLTVRPKVVPSVPPPPLDGTSVEGTRNRKHGLSETQAKKSMGRVSKKMKETIKENDVPPQSSNSIIGRRSSRLNRT